MGLDFAEVLICIEDTFGIDIVEKDAQGLETVGEVVDLVENQVELTRVNWEEAVRLRKEVFDQVGRSLSTQLGLDPESLAEETRLESIIPLEKRPQCWREFPGIPPLRLKLPSCATILIVEGIIITFLLAIAYKALNYYPATNVVIATILIWAFLVFGRILWLRQRERTEFPHGVETILDLVRHSIADRVSLDRNGNPWTRETIEAAVHNIFVEELGFRPQDVENSTKLRDMF